jgi:CheY-specific phosphatase CheX
MMSNLEMELYRSAATTFEDLAFTFAMPELEFEFKNANFEGASSVTFSGPCSGRLIVGLYGQLMASLAANMLGEEEIPTKQQQHDALGEITNIICGNILPEMAGRREVFHIGPPTVVDESAVVAKAQEKIAAEATISLTSGRADVVLYVSESRED